MGINIRDISSNEWSLSIASQGAVVGGDSDIGQCIVVILKTVPGTDPLRPAFGCDVISYLDRPVNFAIPSIVREAALAIEAWEKRAVVTKITPTINAHELTIRIEWKARSREQTKITTIKYGNTP